VLAVAAFVALWIIVALGLVLLATRGSGTARPGRRDPGRRASNITITMFVITAVVFGVGLPLLMLTGNHHNASAQVGGVKLTASEKSGRELFGEHCGVCHTLAGANAVGKVGPNLDILKPAQSIVLHTINNGCLPNPPKGSTEGCLGQGVMPADVVQGQDAQNVAAFVAKVAGNE
jgi:mono/diheme cytochrome c family protein